MIPIEEVITYALSKVGCGYVWGATGQICTEAFIQQMYTSTKDNPRSPFHNVVNYRDLCRKWLGKQVFDCGGLFDHLLKHNISADAYYRNSSIKGKTSMFSNKRGVLVFQANSDGNMYHVGMYIGDGKVVEAQGVRTGVVITTFAGAGWDYWCESQYFDYSEVTDVVASQGQTNELVRAIQRGLIALGYNLGTYNDEFGKPTGADADYGSATAVAVADFKKNMGITGDGTTVDEATFIALLKTVALRAVNDIEKENLEADLAIERALNTDLNGKITTLTATVDELRMYQNDWSLLAEIYKRRIV